MSDVVVGARLQLDANDGIKSLKEFKQQLREAQGDVVAMTEKFGATSKEATMAAKRAAELSDAIADAKQLTDSFNPDKKFVALGQSLNGVLGGFTALTGAMGLLGVESEEVQKQLLKVQSALALSQGLNQIGDSIQSFKTLGKTLVDTLGKNGLIGIAIAGVGALALAFSGLFKRNRDLIEANKEYVKGLGEARVEISKLENSIEQAKAGIISKEDALKQYNSTLGQVTGEVQSLDAAETLLAANADKYVKIQGLKAKANYLLGESAKASAEAEILRLGVESGELTGSRFRSAADHAIGNAERRAAQLEALVNGINQQIAGLQGTIQKSIGGNIGAAGKGTAKTPLGKSAEAETAEAELFFSEYYDNRLLREQAFQDKWLENRRLFLEQGRELQAEDLAKEQEEFYRQLDVLEAIAQEEVMIEEWKAESKQRLWQSTGSALGALADLVGKQTAAGKVLAIAEATINTYLAASNILKNTARNPVTGAIPGFAVAQMIATIVSGLVTVRNIVKTPVPGHGGGGGNFSAPLQPQAPQATRTQLDQRQLNQLGNATTRAFVVESDITNNQERIRRINRQARI